MSYLTTLDQAEEFFKRCMERNADSREARMKILEEMATERRVFALSEEALHKRLNGRRILKVEGKKELHLVKNSAMCLKCKEVLVSRTRHDFVTCKCGAVSIDGGLDYRRVLAKESDYKSLSVYE